MAPPAAPNPPPLDALAPGTFHSLLPTLDELLSIIHSQSTSPNPVSPIEAAQAVATKVSVFAEPIHFFFLQGNALDDGAQARELHSSLESMRSAALNLPRGHLSTARIEQLSGMLEQEAEKRRAVLRMFARRDMRVVDELLAGKGEESGIPTPAQGDIRPE